MKLITTLAISLTASFFCTSAIAADLYNFTKSEYFSDERVTVKTTQRIHNKSNIWYLKTTTKHIDHNGRKSRTKVYYSCWNGNGTPYTNLSQSWVTTNKDLVGCPNNLPSK